MRKASRPGWLWLLVIWVCAAILSAVLDVTLPINQVMKTHFWAFPPLVVMESGIALAFASLALAFIIDRYDPPAPLSLPRCAGSAPAMIVAAMLAIGCLSFVWR
jgi:hypothetical protein